MERKLLTPLEHDCLLSLYAYVAWKKASILGEVHVQTQAVCTGWMGQTYKLGIWCKKLANNYKHKERSVKWNTYKVVLFYLVWENISSDFIGNNVRVVCKDGVQDRTVVLP